MKTNEDIVQLASSDLSCTLCDKKYKTAPGLQKHLQTKHETIAQSSAQILPEDSRILRKRRGPDNPVTDCPPPKTMALDSSGPSTTSDVAISPPALAPPISSTISLPEQPVATTSSGTYSSSINFNLNAEPFEPYPYPRTDFPHYDIQMQNIGG